MRLYSSNRRTLEVGLREAVLQGLAQDGGLFMPTSIPLLPLDFFRRLPQLSIQALAFEVAKALLQESVPEKDLRRIVETAITFDAPLVKLDAHLYALELFSGPTLAFKDFGARFLAQLLSYFLQDEPRDLLVLVATSGDTGSAVGYGFLNLPRTRVVLLYPSGKVSHIQEQQLTTIGGNVIALEVQGTFDDCQRLVKSAFLDEDIRARWTLSSANSINIARLLPQTFYYFRAVAQLPQADLPIIFSVPSGNFGNLTAGLLAKKMGLAVQKFIAATNANDIVPKYLHTGIFEPKPSQRTLSNAMDVGNPSNFARMHELYPTHLHMQQDIFGISFSDAETAAAIQHIYQKYAYITEPHGAIGYLGLQAYQQTLPEPTHGIFLATAHPAKFADIVEPLLPIAVEMPERLRYAISKPKRSVLMPNNFEHLKAFLLKLS
ncbi:MAG: threonine synthase [Candidatus Thermochlorobacter sp.]